MADTGTGTDPTTDRCPDCGHPSDAGCPCYCCPRLPNSRYLGGWHWAAVAEYERIAALLGWRE